MKNGQQALRRHAGRLRTSGTIIVTTRREPDKEMTEENKDDEDDHDAVEIRIGPFIKVNLFGKTVAKFLPYFGWAMIVAAAAYAITVIIGALQ